MQAKQHKLHEIQKRVTTSIAIVVRVRGESAAAAATTVVLAASVGEARGRGRSQRRWLRPPALSALWLWLSRLELRNSRAGGQLGH